MSEANSQGVTIRDVELARERLAGVVKPTPLIHSETLSRMLAAEVYIKPENLQKTGSFKIRGAYNRIAALSPAEAAWSPRRPAITARHSPGPPRARACAR
jgi:threonine dehydratase